MGLTVKLFPVTEYVFAPEGMIVKLLPEQVVPLFTEITGKAKTVTCATAVLDDTQPAELVPVTAYDVLVVGLTVKVLPVIVYVCAPDGTKVMDLPEQSVALFTDTTGNAKTVTVESTGKDVQPALLVPTTE
jgi:hypothetical protein